jgi:hypothetical protein
MIKSVLIYEFFDAPMLGNSNNNFKILDKNFIKNNKLKKIIKIIKNKNKII